MRTTPGRRTELLPVPGSEIITGVEYRELQTRPSITGWTPELVACVADDADAGIMQGLADLVDAMQSDDHIEGVLGQLTYGTFGLPLQFKGGDPDLLAELRGEIPEVGGEWDCMHPETESAKIYKWGVMAGFAPFQRVPLPRLYGQPQRHRIVAWHPRWLSYDHMGASGSHWRIQTRTGIKRIVPGGQFGMFLPYGELRPWNEGKWRKTCFPWIVKRFALEDRANQGEVVGSPTWVGTSTQGGTEAQRRRFLAELQKLGRNGRIVLPDGWQLDLKEADGKTFEIFSESTEWADKAITIAIASQVTTTDGSAGFDSGKTQENILANITRYFAKQYARCLYYQSTQPWAQANTGDKRNAPYGYWNTERQNTQASQATMFETLGRAIPELDAGLSRSGLMVDGAAVSNTFGVPVKSNAGAAPIVQTTPTRTPPTEPKRPGPLKPTARVRTNTKKPARTRSRIRDEE